MGDLNPARPAEERVESEPEEVPEILRIVDLKQRLRAIEKGDPLELGARTQRRLRKECLFLAPGRLIQRAMARTAIGALKYEGVPGLAQWLDEVITISIGDLLREQEREEYGRMPIAESIDCEFYREFASFAKLPERYGRLACLVMNQLARFDRETFFAVVVEGKSIHRWAAEGHGPPQRIKDSLKRLGLRMIQVIERAERNGGDGGLAHGF